MIVSFTCIVNKAEYLIMAYFLCYSVPMNLHRLIILCSAILLSVSCTSTDTASKYPAMLADIEPFSLGAVSASLDRSFSSKERDTDVEVFLHPRQNEVELNFTNGISYFRQFWNQEARECFIRAHEKYKEDFAGGQLINKQYKTRAVYGKAKGRFLWKTMAVSPVYRASPGFEFGYRFRNGEPFLTVYQKAADEENKTSSEGIKQSPQYYLYFTPAQSEDLVRYFDQAFLLWAVGGMK